MKSEHVKTLTTKALDDLAAALEAGKSDTLERFLTIAGRFPRYSFRNVMLIATQRPDATQVAGFNTWKALGRFVKKGEKGIVIIAPMRFRRDNPEPPAAVEGVVPDCGMRFKAVYVFDVSQTDGEPLGDISQVTGDPGRSIEQLKAAIAARGITLEYSAETGTAEGRSSGGRIASSPLDSPRHTSSRFSRTSWRTKSSTTPVSAAPAASRSSKPKRSPSPFAPRLASKRRPPQPISFSSTRGIPRCLPHPSSESRKQPRRSSPLSRPRTPLPPRSG